MYSKVKNNIDEILKAYKNVFPCISTVVTLKLK